MTATLPTTPALEDKFLLVEPWGPTAARLVNVVNCDACKSPLTAVKDRNSSPVTHYTCSNTDGCDACFSVDESMGLSLKTLRPPKSER